MLVLASFSHRWPTVTALLLALSCAPLSACGPSKAKLPPAAATYRVRAEVVRIDKKHHELSLRHEAIPSFADESGRVVGMQPMVMPFQLAEHLHPELKRLRKGGKLQLRFESRWQGDTPLRIVALKVLPPATTLRF